VSGLEDTASSFCVYVPVERKAYVMWGHGTLILRLLNDPFSSA